MMAKSNLFEERPALGVVVYQDETGAYCGDVPALKGCHSCGDTYEELMANLKDAIYLWFQCTAELALKIPSGARLERVML